MTTSLTSFLTKATRTLLWRTGLGRKAAAGYWKNRQDGAGFRYLHRQTDDIFAHLPTRFTDPVFSAFVGDDSKRWTMQESFVVEVEDVLLEPERLLGIRAGRELVEQTVVYKHDRQYPYILPYLLRPSKVTHLEKAIWYDGSATRNYYHHLVDALISLQQWERSGLPRDTPLLITKKMFDTVYFQYLYQGSPQVRQLNWHVVADAEWVQVKKLYKLQTASFSPAAWRTMRELYALPSVKPWRKVFLNRDRKRYGRYLDNESEVVAMLKRHGFEEMFAENLSIEQQAQLFQETEYLVALHGAGMIQQFFMNYAHSHVIEIMPRNYLMPLYYWQAYAMGIRYYDVVVGGDMRDGQEYPVEVAALEAAVERMLGNQHAGRVYGLTELPPASAVS
ncbi:glycosyltransferase family 61 protein [Hymenobacter rubripertinctus]|uniref:Glycosyltransferase family 61 protein n=1 Tax=Hymenobacter rubripertinctus TaxID=2029981 RepID=A0A418QWM0_9BACT|nr:glycosyltransferase family 61 protein [Hymenobacter rubripertinctus]RIY09524.1 glycosyltransferase family 61 protein [Hymenobacter rubripertinctus]